jgi:hypothetical protein
MAIFDYINTFKGFGLWVLMVVPPLMQSFAVHVDNKLIYHFTRNSDHLPENLAERCQQQFKQLRGLGYFCTSGVGDNEIIGADRIFFGKDLIGMIGIPPTCNPYFELRVITDNPPLQIQIDNIHELLKNLTDFEDIDLPPYKRE